LCAYDNEAKNFLFSYEKLFGSKDKTEADLKNEIEGKDTSIERTRRLFYVICSRAKDSLAIVAYSTNPEKNKKHVISEGWFNENEVELLT
jgi:DNA helicase-2/ATP-dependent DNA helicase PcrA